MSFSFFANTMVRQAREQFHYEILRPLEESAGRIKSMLDTVQRERQTARDQMENEITALIPVDGDNMYAAATRAAQAAGATHNFTKLAHETRAADETNRREFSELTQQWGSKQTVFESVRKSESELRRLKPALADIMRQLEDHASASKSIEQHNKDYPGAQITAEDHDRFEKFSFWSWMKFWDRGPHHAYKVLGEYTRNHGDYFENAGKIPGLEKDREDHAEQVASEEKALALHSSVSGRMSQLESGYIGPEKLARNIRNTVLSLLEQNKGDFASKLLAETGAAGVPAVTALVKNRNFERMAEDLNAYKKRMAKITGALDSAGTELKEAESLKPNKWVAFDAGNGSSAARRLVNSTNHALNAAETARRVISAFRHMGPAALNSTDDVQDEILRSLIRTPGTDLSFVHGVFTIDRRLARQEGVSIESLRRRDYSEFDRFPTDELIRDVAGITAAVQREITEEREAERRRKAEEAAAQKLREEQAEQAKKNAAAATAAIAATTSLGASFGDSAVRTSEPPRNNNDDDDMFGGDAGITDVPRRSP